MMLTTQEVAERLRCSTESVRRAIHRGDLPAFRYGNLLRVDSAALERFVARCTR